MRALIQRVKHARVRIEDDVSGEIDGGLLVFLGVGKDDTLSDVDLIVRKVSFLRIFDDEKGKMNRNLFDVRGKILLVSQFTLYGNCRRGLRPSYDQAADPTEAEHLYREVATGLKNQGVEVEEGIFGAVMQVDLCNDGPVTIWLDSKERRNG
ncbi:MAG: D-aminoacyl-tRNA deacylase [Candidatus Atribacteria bacterium]|nr:D-aminoacyl-tRNA deacylase [Candidatus Atribacteria bacterium]